MHKTSRAVRRAINELRCQACYKLSTRFFKLFDNLGQAVQAVRTQLADGLYADLLQVERISPKCIMEQPCHKSDDINKLLQVLNSFFQSLRQFRKSEENVQPKIVISSKYCRFPPPGMPTG